MTKTENMGNSQIVKVHIKYIIDTELHNESKNTSL